MSIKDNQHEFRFNFFVSCAEMAAQHGMAEGITVTMRPDYETKIGEFVDEYRSVRHEFATYHGIGEEGRLMNFKVVALMVYLISRKPAETYFQFLPNAADHERRAIMAGFKLNVVKTLCWLRNVSTQSEEELMDDLEYCLADETPMNVEYLCFAFHGLCVALGDKTALEKH